MSAADHLKAFRLFDLAKGDSSDGGFQLLEWEREHFQGCEECQRLEAFFRRQLTERPLSYMNGEVSPANGWYRNVCCNLELYVLAGKTFPDCRRHRNLPTSWRPLDEDARKQSA
jgi:hypothetical protein